MNKKSSQEICEELTGESMEDMGLVEECEENDYTEPCDNSECRYWHPAYQDCVAEDCFYQPEEDLEES